MAVVAGHELLEREDVLDALGGALSDAVGGSGRLVLVAGESGVGKTAAVRAFIDASCRRRPVHFGACDPLSTPAPLAPFLDLAAGTLPGLAAALARPGTAYDVFAALRSELGDGPAVLVLEDVHWADEASLDVLRVLGRRVAATPLLVVATYRDEPAGRLDPLRVALGDLAGANGVIRISIDPLSAEAVRTLAEGRGVDSEELVRRTGGNPFYVIEVLEAGDDSIPATVRDAVLARVARLEPDARDVLDVIACSPQASEQWVLDAVGAGHVASAWAGVAAGVLVEAGAGFAFRHEIAREAVADALPADRRAELNRGMLAALAAARVPIDPARLAHHADEAGDAEAAVRHARAAAERAAAVGAHREAAAQYSRALRFSGDDAPSANRADLLERRASALYAADDQLGSIADLHEAIALHREIGDLVQEARATALLVPRLTCCGHADEARIAAERAVGMVGSSDVPEAVGALAALAHVDLVQDRLADAMEHGRRALAADDRIGSPDARIESAIVVGTAAFLRDGPAASGTLEQVLETARRPEHEVHLAHVLNNLAIGSMYWRDHEAAERFIDEGLAYTAGHDLDLWRLSILGLHVRSLLNQGRWTEALDTATAILADVRASPGPRAEALAVLAVVRARRGDPAPPGALAEASAHGGDPAWVVQVACAEAEIAWLDGRSGDIGALTEHACTLATHGESPWAFGSSRSGATAPGFPGHSIPRPRSPSRSSWPVARWMRPPHGSSSDLRTRPRSPSAWRTTMTRSARRTGACGRWAPLRPRRSPLGACASVASAASRAARAARPARTLPS
jgi:tetratricopeptide (TPR) repeat protein